MNCKNHFDIDEIYRNIPEDEIPWNIKAVPKALAELVESDKVAPCKALDLGCGTGNYAVYLALKGFNVTGVDLSPTAIKLAQEKAKKQNLPCKFIVADVLGNLNKVKGTFDFVYDWGLLHHIFPNQRQRYIENVYEKLNSGGHYLSVCFSERDSDFAGSDKYRKTSLGTVLYFSSEDELKKLFEPYFHIDQLKTIQIPNQNSTHTAIYVLMKGKKELYATES